MSSLAPLHWIQPTTCLAVLMLFEKLWPRLRSCDVNNNYNKTCHGIFVVLKFEIQIFLYVCWVCSLKHLRWPSLDTKSELVFHRQCQKFWKYSTARLSLYTRGSCYATIRPQIKRIMYYVVSYLDHYYAYYRKSVAIKYCLERHTIITIPTVVAFADNCRYSSPRVSKVLGKRNNAKWKKNPNW